jgi:hypothetical protein
MVGERGDRHHDHVDARRNRAVPAERVHPDGMATPMAGERNPQEVTLQPTVGKVLEQREADASASALGKRLQQVRCRVRQGEELPAPGHGHSAPRPGVALRRGQKLDELSIELLLIEWQRGQQPRRCLRQVARVAAVLSHQRRQPREHGLEDHHSRVFVVRGQHEAVRGEQKPGYVVTALGEKPHVVGHAKPGGHAAERLGIVTPQNEQPGTLIEWLRKRLQRQERAVETLLDEP